jgi:hypothetical protein
MVSVSHTAHNIEITAESLQEDLARLEVQKQALERELAAVVAHLGSVQRALEALQAVMSATAGPPAPAGAAAEPGRPASPREDAPSPAAADTTGARRRQPAAVRRSPQKPASPSRSGGGNATSRSQAAGEGAADTKYGELTEQILEYFAQAGAADLRARDVAAALGRDRDSGSINAVRSTLDRLVGTSRIARTGRGLYRAKQS